MTGWVVVFSRVNFFVGCLLVVVLVLLLALFVLLLLSLSPLKVHPRFFGDKVLGFSVVFFFAAV